jgi:hypothetical protein
MFAARRTHPVILGTVITGRKCEFRLLGVNGNSCGKPELDDQQENGNFWGHSSHTNYLIHNALIRYVHHPLLNRAGEPLLVLCRARIKFGTAPAALVLFLKVQLVDERAIEVKAQLKRLLVKIHDHHLISTPHYLLDECIGKATHSF